MENIMERVRRARTNEKEAEKLLREYLPFIKKQLYGLGQYGLDYDDMLSIAMITFSNCIRQYEEGRGSFLDFAKVSIRNRLIDEIRKENRYRNIIRFKTGEEEENTVSEEDKEALEQYSKERERQSLEEEIERLVSELKEYQIELVDLVKSAPKQERTRKKCIQIAHMVAEDKAKREGLKRQHKLPQGELLAAPGVSIKTLEKYRKYIITLVLLLTGDYPGIKTYLPQEGGRKA